MTVVQQFGELERDALIISHSHRRQVDCCGRARTGEAHTSPAERPLLRRCPPKPPRRSPPPPTPTPTHTPQETSSCTGRTATPREGVTGAAAQLDRVAFTLNFSHAPRALSRALLPAIWPSATPQGQEVRILAEATNLHWQGALHCRLLSHD